MDGVSGGNRVSSASILSRIRSGGGRLGSFMGKPVRWLTRGSNPREHIAGQRDSSSSGVSKRQKSINEWRVSVTRSNGDKPSLSRKDKIKTQLGLKSTVDEKLIKHNTSSELSGEEGLVIGKKSRKAVLKAFKKAGHKPTPALSVGVVLDKFKSGKMSSLGGGNVAAVFMGEFKLKGEAKPSKYVFKPERPGEQAGGADKIGISNDKPYNLHRAVASYQIAKLMNSNVIARTEVGVVNGELGIAMAFSGNMGSNEFPADYGEIQEGSKHEKVLNNYKQLGLGSDNKLNLAEYGGSYSDFESDLRGQNIEATRGADDVYEFKAIHYKPITITNTKEEMDALEQQFEEIQCLDIICNQIDRHGGNIRFDFEADGKVRQIYGIDNEAAFGSKKAGFDDITQGDGSTCQKPVSLSKKTSEKILSIDERKLRQLLDETLPADEVDLTMSRLKGLKDHILKMEGNTDADRHEIKVNGKALEKTEKNSYFMRWEAKFQAKNEEYAKMRTT